METYKQSVKDYGDMFTVEEKGIEKGLKKGIVIGKKRGIVIGKKRGIAKGIEEGIEEGIAKGIEEERKRTVKGFRNQGKSIKEIAELLYLTEEQVYSLLEKTTDS
jgi:predicted transposase YdaD